MTGALSEDMRRQLVMVMVKHLPPSGSRLRLLDVGGQAEDVLTELRHDLEVQAVEDLVGFEADTVDSIVALSHPSITDDDFQREALRVLRPGGRLIMALSTDSPTKSQVQQLESNGHTRILVEPALTEPHTVGVLLRGEKPHTTQSTFARIRVAADNDADQLSLEDFDGPYVFVLVHQTPNKPVWALREGETLAWNGLSVMDGDVQTVVGFTSLPKAISLMQPAVMQGIVQDINKVAKFSRVTALGWDMPVLLNPTLDQLQTVEIRLISLDPATAEAPDE
jgi:hypothetical protein